MKILLTGATGFIGTHVHKELEPRPYIFQGDITNEADVTRNLRDIDTVIHLAASTYVPPSWQAPEAYFRTNTLGTLNFLRHHEMFSRFVYFSTSHVFGLNRDSPLTEDSIPMPADPYAASKLAAENLVKAYGERYGFSYLIIRPFNNFGPGQSHHFAIPSFIRQFKREGRITVRGNTERDFVYVKDTAKIVRNLVNIKVDGGPLLICQGEGWTMRQMALMITKDIMKVHEIPNPRAKWDIPSLIGDKTSLRAIMPNFEFTPMQRAMDETVEYYDND